MTTYTLTGLRVTKTDPDGDGKFQKHVFGDSVFKLVAADSNKTFDYSYPSQFDTFVNTNFYAYKVSFSGAKPKTSWETEISEISWGNNKVSTVFITGGRLEKHLFVIDGDPLPEMDSRADLRAYVQSITGFDQISSGTFTAGSDINLMDLQGMTQTQNDKINGTNGGDTLLGGRGNDKISGGKGQDDLSGGKGSDVLLGGAGQDHLSGGSGNDRLKGGGGQDRLYGDTGNDRLTGGGGQDYFHFKAQDGNDQVMDFQDGIDKLVLNANLWSGQMTAAEVLNYYGMDADGNVFFSFGTDTLTIHNMSKADLLDDIVLF